MTQRSISASAPRFNDAKLQQELSRMGGENREQALSDISGGSSHVAEEEPEFLQAALVRLEEELRSIQKKDAFDLAQLICPDYVNSDNFRLTFLRADRFESGLAARRLVKYWDRKISLFGEDRAFRPLTIADMLVEDETAIARGGIRHLPDRDEAGRGILFSSAALWDHRASYRNSMLRLAWLVVHDIIKDVDVQRNGIVSLSSETSAPFFDSKLWRMYFRDVNEALPVRFVGMHSYVDNETKRLLLETVFFALTPELRARYRLHNGTQEENAQALETYGVATRIIPPELGGTLTFNYRAWLEETRAHTH